MKPTEWNIIDAEFREQQDYGQTVVVVLNVKEEVVVEFVEELISRHFTDIRANEPKVDPEKEGQSQFTEESPLEHEGGSFGEKAIIH